MWVIVNADTGMEVERVVTRKERDEFIETNIDPDYGNRHVYRWES